MATGGRTTRRDGAGRFQARPADHGAAKPLLPAVRAHGLTAVLARDGEAVMRRLIDRALAGDVGMARLLLDRLAPKPRGRPLPLDLPPDADIDTVYDAIFAALVAGRIAPEEALRVARFLDRWRRLAPALRLQNAAREHAGGQNAGADAAAALGRAVPEGSA
jgi:hypothetical protein